MPISPTISTSFRKNSVRLIFSARHIPYLRGVFGEEIKQYHTVPPVDFLFRYREALATRALDPRWSFLLLHIRMPHLPFIYDLENETYGHLPRDHPLGYWGNLVALDKFIGNLRARFEAGRHIGGYDSRSVLR